MTILKRQVTSSSNFVSLFIFMKRNSTVSFKLMHFLFWKKGSHQSPNFETFESSGKKFPNFPRHFPNHKSVFLQILHHSSESWNITPLHFFISNIIYFVQNEPIKVKDLRISSVQVKISTIFVIFETTNQFFFEYCVNLQSYKTNPLYFLAEILYTFNKRRLSHQTTNLVKISCEQ